jgi:hypothetical protein
MTECHLSSSTITIIVVDFHVGLVRRNNGKNHGIQQKTTKLGVSLRIQDKLNVMQTVRHV